MAKENGSTKHENKELFSNTAKEKNGTIDKPLDNVTEFTAADGGILGWVVCVTSFWCNGILFGILNTFGILFVALMDEFSDSGYDDLAFKISWIGSLQIALTFMLSPLASMFVDVLGIRITAFIGSIIATFGMFASSFVTKLELFYLTYGVFLGAGSSLVYTPSMVILGHYFKSKLGLVNGIVSFGSAVFTFILPVVMKPSLEHLGLRWTMRLLSILYSVLVLCALSWKPQFSTTKSQKDKENSGVRNLINTFCNTSIWKNKGYVVWVIALPVSFLGYFVPFVHLVQHTNDVMPEVNAGILVMCLGATSGISRLICGKVADIPKMNRIRMQQFAFFIMGAATSCIPFAKNFWVLVIIVLIMGVCDGCFICLLGPIAFDLLGPSGAARGLGCLLGLMSIPMTAGPPIAGFLYDSMGSYTVAFIVAGAPPIVGACILFLAPYKQQVVTDVTVCVDDVLSEHPDEVDNNEYTGSTQHVLGSTTGLMASLRNIPIVVETDPPPAYPLPNQSLLSEDKRKLTSSQPNLRKDLLKKTTGDPTMFSSIPQALNNV